VTSGGNEIPRADKFRVTRHPPLVTYFMSDILSKTIVLVLNRNWQAINIHTPADAFCQMATNVATALDIEFDGDAEAGEASRHLSPVTRHASERGQKERKGVSERGQKGVSSWFCEVVRYWKGVSSWFCEVVRY
jgi:hypothetical protein